MFDGPHTRPLAGLRVPRGLRRGSQSSPPPLSSPQNEVKLWPPQGSEDKARAGGGGVCGREENAAG